MSHSRIFKQIISAANLTVATANATDTEAGATRDIDFSAKETIIGIGCITVGMVAVLAYFCIQNQRNHKSAQIIIPVTVKRATALTLGDAIWIPQLNIKRELLESERLTIQSIGLREFLKNEIHTFIRNSDQPIQDNLSVRQVADVFLAKADPAKGLGAHDLLENIQIDYLPKRNRCNFFLTVLPPLTRATLLFEVLFGTVQALGALQLAPPILPISREANNNVVIVQTVLSAIFSLLLIYAGPGQAFMSDLGITIDRRIIDFFTGKKNQTLEQKPELPKSLKYKMWVMQGVLITLILNNLYSEIINDYQSTMSLNDRINAQKDSIIPAWAVYFCSMVEFGLNQLNDPVMLFSEILMVFMLTHAYFYNKHAAESQVDIEVINDSRVHSSDEEKRVVSHLASASDLQGFGQFSPRNNQASSPSTALDNNQSTLKAPLLGAAFKNAVPSV